MSTEFILICAIGVFFLMSIGIILSIFEFNRLTDEPSIRKGTGGPERSQHETKSINTKNWGIVTGDLHHAFVIDSKRPAPSPR